MAIPLCSALVRLLEYCGQFWATRYETDVGKWEQVQLRAAKTISGRTRRAGEGWVWSALRRSDKGRSYCSLQLPHWQGGGQRRQSQALLCWHSARTRGKGHQIEHGTLIKCKEGNFHLSGCQSMELGDFHP